MNLRLTRCVNHLKLPLKNSPSQRGDTLIESMIGLLLLSIIGIGTSHIVGKTAVSQRDSKVQQGAINELRSLVMNRKKSDELCSQQDLVTDNFSVTVGVSGCHQTSATINGVQLDAIQAPVVLSAELPGLGEVRVGGAIGNN